MAQRTQLQGPLAKKWKQHLTKQESREYVSNPSQQMSLTICLRMPNALPSFQFYQCLKIPPLLKNEGDPTTHLHTGRGKAVQSQGPISPGERPRAGNGGGERGSSIPSTVPGAHRAGCVVRLHTRPVSAVLRPAGTCQVPCRRPPAARGARPQLTNARGLGYPTACQEASQSAPISCRRGRDGMAVTRRLHDIFDAQWSGNGRFRELLKDVHRHVPPGLILSSLFRDNHYH